MAKKRIEIILKTNNETLKNNVSALISKNDIKYLENDIKVDIKLMNNQINMIRENAEYQLNLIFEKNKKTTGIYLLKDYNLKLMLDIFTQELINDENKINIKYILNDEIHDFIINIKE